MDHLPLRPIVPNIYTASCQLGKYLGKLLFPLSQSNCTINSSKVLPSKIRCEKIPGNCNIVSFDVKSLFTLVPLEHIIDITIKQINKIPTIFAKSEMKKLFFVKKYTFTFQL